MKAVRGLSSLALAVVVGCGSPAAAPGADVPRSADDTPVTEVDGGAIVTTVERVVDGDTVYVADIDTRLRLIGIDAPETDPERGVECHGAQATGNLEDLLPEGTEVRVVFDVERHDRFGRPLGYLYRTGDGLFVNARLLADGDARPLTIPPNVAHEADFAAAARRAREAGRGLWSACPAER